MKLSDFERVSGATCLTGSYEDREIACGYTCDLLSHVMGKGQADMAWITVQAHMNVIAVAALPIIWMLAAPQPFNIHHWFQYRSIALSFFSFGIYCLLTLAKPKEITE